LMTTQFYISVKTCEHNHQTTTRNVLDCDQSFTKFSHIPRNCAVTHGLPPS